MYDNTYMYPHIPKEMICITEDFRCSTAQQSKDNIPEEIVISELSDFFKIFGDYTRIKLLFAIKDNELCVHDLGLILGMQQPAVSHQLKTLRKYKLVSVRREGKLSYYSLSDKHIFDILDIGLEHLVHFKEKD